MSYMSESDCEKLNVSEPVTHWQPVHPAVGCE